MTTTELSDLMPAVATSLAPLISTGVAKSELPLSVVRECLGQLVLDYPREKTVIVRLADTYLGWANYYQNGSVYTFGQPEVKVEHN